MEMQLPKNWVETYLYNATEPVKTGVKPYGIEKEYFSTGSIKDNSFKIEGLYLFKQKPSRANREVLVGDVLQARMFETDKAIIINEKCKDALFSTGFIQLRVYSNTINQKYLFYYVKSDIFHNQKNELASGTTQVAINDLNAKKITFPLPPLPEQNRIVAKLDTLFAQLEIIKTSMATVPVLLKNFRQQVLTQAVSGKLTESWRVGKELEEWKKMKLSDFSISKLGKMLDGAKNTGELINYLGNINIRWFEIDFTNLKQLKIEPNEIHKYILLKGDVLVCEGGEPGRSAIWKYERNDVIFQKALHRIRLNENVLPDFFLYNLRVDTINNKLTQLFTGTTIKHLTGRSFSTYTISIPPLKEQREIVSRVESLFTKADAIEKQYQTLKEKIDNLPQAILHKAFKGELTEQLDSDGDARELLKEIEALKATVGKVKNIGKVEKRTKKKKAI
ncbi:restriction endonuclease subunit S [Flavobacterium flavigenum]|uniref:restriction endonuclease subunit S n=1 Tax=Flavobacterium flavigenum TaxID=3003258 RepID=UPI002482ECDA|nr:restriction endonuclease subunit S [Flavobacterium flavigenum]